MATAAPGFRFSLGSAGSYLTVMRIGAGVRDAGNRAGRGAT